MLIVLWQRCATASDEQLDDNWATFWSTSTSRLRTENGRLWGGPKPTRRRRILHTEMSHCCYAERWRDQKVSSLWWYVFFVRNRGCLVSEASTMLKLSLRPQFWCEGRECFLAFNFMPVLILLSAKQCECWLSSNTRHQPMTGRRHRDRLSQQPVVARRSEGFPCRCCVCKCFPHWFVSQPNVQVLRFVKQTVSGKFSSWQPVTFC